MEETQKKHSKKATNTKAKSREFTDSRGPSASKRLNHAKEPEPFKPKTFKELWLRIEESLNRTSADSETGHNRDKYNKKKAELRKIAKELWYENENRRKILYAQN